MIEKVNIEKQLTVKELRILMNLSQKNFAKLVGIPYSTYVKRNKVIPGSWHVKLNQLFRKQVFLMKN